MRFGIIASNPFRFLEELRLFALRSLRLSLTTILHTSDDITAFAEAPAADDMCYTKMRSAYQAYTSKGKPGLIDYLYTDYLDGSEPGVYCYAVNGTDASESIVIGTWFGKPTAVPGQVSFSVSASLNKTRAESDFALGGWNNYYDDAENLCCGPDKAWLYCSPVLKVDGCGTDPKYTYTNETNLGAIFNADGEKGDGTIFCGCQFLLGEEATPFGADPETVQRVLADVRGASGGDRVAFASAALAGAILMMALV